MASRSPQPRKHSLRYLAKIVAWFGSDTNFIKVLCTIVSEQHKTMLAKTLFECSSYCNRVLDVAKTILKLESAQHYEDKSKLLRRESVFSIFASQYGGLLMAKYIKNMLGKYLTELISQQKNLSLEAGNDHLNIEENRKRLCKITEEILDIISLKFWIEKIPKEVRTICTFIENISAQYLYKNYTPLIAAFFVNSLLIPTIEDPETHHICKLSSSFDRNNLYLISTLLLKLASNTLFDENDKIMAPFNEFLMRNQQKMNEYLRAIPSQLHSSPKKDSNHENTEFGIVCGVKRGKCMVEAENCDCAFYVAGEETEMFEDLQCMNCGHTPDSHQYLGEEDTEGDRDLKRTEDADEEVDTEALKEIDVDSIQFLLNAYIDLVLVNLMKQSIQGDTKESSLRRAGEMIIMMKLLNKSQPVPPNKHKQLKHLMRATFFACEDIFETKAFEDMRVCHRGADDLKGHEVFYFHANRLDEEVFVSSQMDDLVMHLIDTLNLKEHVLKSSSEPLREYSVVVDLTWCTPPQSLKNGKEILRTISFIEPFFPSGVRRALKHIFLVHAPHSALQDYLRLSFTPDSLKTKIIEIDDWRKLSQYLHYNHIELSDESKNFITLSNFVVKANDRNKCRPRTIKLTVDSILNIDPKTCEIKNEKLLRDIEEIKTPSDYPELTLKFINRTKKDKDDKEKRVVVFPSKKHVKGITHETHKLIFRSIKERDALVEEINWIKKTFKHFHYCQAFKVLRLSESEKSKKSERFESLVIKLTIDSVLYLDDKKIIKEVSYAGIETVAVSTETEQELVLIKYKGEVNVHKISCKYSHTKQFIEAILDGMQRFKKNGVFVSPQSVMSSVSSFVIARYSCIPQGTLPFDHHQIFSANPTDYEAVSKEKGTGFISRLFGRGGESTGFFIPLFGPTSPRGGSAASSSNNSKESNNNSVSRKESLSPRNTPIPIPSSPRSPRRGSNSPSKHSPRSASPSHTKHSPSPPNPKVTVSTSLESVPQHSKTSASPPEKHRRRSSISIMPFSFPSSRKRSISPPDKEIKPKEEEKEQEKDNNHEFVPIVTVTPVATEQQLPQSSQQGDVGNNSQWTQATTASASISRNAQVSDADIDENIKEYYNQSMALNGSPLVTPRRGFFVPGRRTSLQIDTFVSPVALPKNRQPVPSSLSKSNSSAWKAAAPKHLNADRKAVFTFEEVEAIKQGYEAQISQLQQRVQKLKEENECLQLEFDELKKIIDNEKKNLTKELENILEAAEKPDNTANELASLRKLLRRSSSFFGLEDIAKSIDTAVRRRSSADRREAPLNPLHSNDD